MGEPLLIIDPGHGGKDSGGGSSKYFKEKEMNLKISLYQFQRFKELGVPVSITRSEDTYLSPTDRSKIVKESGATYCISNHINAASSEARGVETIHSIYADGSLATAFYNAIVGKGIPGRRVFSKESGRVSGKDYYYMHRETGAVRTVIIEYGFATNSTDAKLINDNWEKYAEAVVKAFCNYTGKKYEAPKKENKEEPPNMNNLPTIQNKAIVKIGETEVPAYITSEGKTVVEVRELANALDMEIEWDNQNKTVTLKGRQGYA